MVKLSTRERFLNAIDFKDVDYLPFWAKLSPTYLSANGLKYNSIQEFFIDNGLEFTHYLPDYCEFVGKGTSYDVTFENGRMILHFGIGINERNLVMGFDIPSGSYHPIDYPIKDLEDILFMSEWYSKCSNIINKEKYNKQCEIITQNGNYGVTAHTISESSLMFFIEYLAGIENGHYLIADYCDEIDELFSNMKRLNRDRCKLALESKADMVYFVENTSTTIISISQYIKYTMNELKEYGEILKPSKRFTLHMCGHIKGLLNYVNETNADVYEALTTPTLGNTTFEDVRNINEKVALIGGTNANTWLKNCDEIFKEIEKSIVDLKSMKGIVISSAGVLPNSCKPETLIKVSNFIRNEIKIN